MAGPQPAPTAAPSPPPPAPATNAGPVGSPSPTAPAAAVAAPPAAAAPSAAAAAPKAAAAKPPPLIPYTGLPNFSLPKKLPHRNWFIFGALVAIPTYAWYADRESARELKEQYLARVRHLGQERLANSLDGVRTANVYCARFPGEDGGFAADWFKKYLKPYLVAAAVDYNLPSVPQYTSLVQLLADKYHLLRQAAADPSSVPPLLPGKLSPQDERRRDVEGGVILIGRQSLKEYMEGLRKGWTEDREEDWEAKLDMSMFEDPALPPLAEGEVRPPPVKPSAPVNLFPLTKPPPREPEAPAVPAERAPLPPAPSPLPPLPAVLCVPYTPNLGFSSVPRAIWGFFNQTAHTRVGGEAALAFILGQPTPALAPPAKADAPFIAGEEKVESQGGTLDWGKADEYYIPGSFEKLPKEVDDAMADYYKGLQKKVAVAWEIQNGRELTDNEQKYPPPTLAQLKEERLKKERRARQNRAGYLLHRKESGVAWDPRLAGAFGVWEWDADGRSVEKEGSA